MEKFGIVITAKTRHGAIWDAARQAGGASSLARQVGTNVSTMGRWINLKVAPPATPKPGSHLAGVIARLEDATGQTASQLWPVELRAAIRGGLAGLKIERRHEVELRALAESFRSRLELPAPDAGLLAVEQGEFLDDMLRRLPERQALVVRLRYGIGGDGPLTLTEIGQRINVCAQRVRDIEAAALRKLRGWGCELARGTAGDDIPV